MTERLAYKIAAAAEQVDVSPETIRRAIKATDPTKYPPPLRAKNAGTDTKPSYRIAHADLIAWFDSLSDA